MLQRGTLLRHHSRPPAARPCSAPAARRLAAGRSGRATVAASAAQSDAEAGAVLKELEAVTARSDAFGARAHLQCPPGCGACCLSPNIEATVAELLPLAEAVASRGNGSQILEQLRAVVDRGDSRCFFYTPADSDASGRTGRCAEYAHRPVVCRTFGFAGHCTKDGAPALAACRTMAEASPDAVRAATDAVSRDDSDESLAAAMPIIADEARGLLSFLLLKWTPSGGPLMF